jgi:pyridinium-3,5-biscarboxylic acid mononucleotide sulfurtransferase
VEAEPSLQAPGERAAPEAIVAALRQAGPALVALSGGTDSAVVAYLAFRALGAKAHAVTLTGAAVSAEERESAARSAGAIGISHTFLVAEPLQDGNYGANPVDRCYYCRRVESHALREFGEARGVTVLMDGVHLDDLQEYRPGLRAMAEAGVQHPLVQAGWRKADVRAFAQQIGLPNWDRPSNACLASRVQHHEPVTAALLGRVEAAERWLLQRGFRRVRVKVSAGNARVVVGVDEAARLLEEPMAAEARTALVALGFSAVTLDSLGSSPPPGAERR